MEALKPIQIRSHSHVQSRLGTLAILVIYAAVIVSTNHLFTFLDDEAMSVALAGNPVIPAVERFFAGSGLHEEHPPMANILSHLWLIATDYSFFSLRIFANIFYVAAMLVNALSAEKIGGRRAYWAILVLSSVWPFAFQYGRITGWYALSMFLVSLVTWTYLRILDTQGYRPWIAFGAAGVLLVWSNYFGFVILFVLLADFLIFHRDLAVSHVRPLLIVMALIALAFFPLLRVALQDLVGALPIESRMDWKNEIVGAGFPAFAIFGSVAVAPWYLPLSGPLFVAIVLLLVCAWFSPGRRWFVYFILAMLVLDVSGQLDVKRVLFLMPWLFLAIALAAGASTSRHPRLAFSALAIILVCGWVGIVSGRHYATANLYEPWEKVAEVVAQDARHGATIISENPSFFFYLDYQLRLQSDTGEAPGTYLGEPVYQSHGYRILWPDPSQRPQDLHGKVVLVTGTASQDDLELENALNDKLRARCSTLGQYRAAPDPAAVFKQRFSKIAPVLAYRTEVVWYDCPL